MTTSALALAAAWLLLAVPAGAVVLMDYETQLDMAGGVEGASLPETVSVDPATGEVCVTDVRANALHVFDARGVARFTTALVSGLSSPAGACPDGAGGFVVIDRGDDGRRTLRRLDFRGEPRAPDYERPSDDWVPTHLTATPDGALITLDETGGVMCRHHALTGALEWSAPIAGGLTDLVCGRPGVAPDGRLYVPVASEHYVRVYTAEGEPVASFGVLGSTAGRFSFPVDVAFGPEDSVLVLDRMRNKVLVFDADHDFVTEHGRYGAAPGSFYHPVSMARHGDRLYVAQGYGSRVQVFRIYGSGDAR